jgi:hypothetical protein
MRTTEFGGSQMSSVSPSIRANAVAVPDVSLLRLYLLRAGYLLLVAGLGVQLWPSMFHHAPWTFWQGVGKSFLTAISVLAILGLRYPLKMLPLLFYEVTWKAIWLLAVPLRMWLAHAPIDANTLETLQECSLVVIFLLVIPWRYVIANFIAAPGDRWK